MGVDQPSEADLAERAEQTKQAIDDLHDLVNDFDSSYFTDYPKGKTSKAFDEWFRTKDASPLYQYALDNWGVDIGDRELSPPDVEPRILHKGDCTVIFVFSPEEYPYYLIGRSDHLLKIQTMGPYKILELKDYADNTLKQLVFSYGERVHQGHYLLDLRKINERKYYGICRDGDVKLGLLPEEINEVVVERRATQGYLGRVLDKIFGVPFKPEYLDAASIQELEKIIREDIRMATSIFEEYEKSLQEPASEGEK